MTQFFVKVLSPNTLCATWQTADNRWTICEKTYGSLWWKETRRYREYKASDGKTQRGLAYECLCRGESSYQFIQAEALTTEQTPISCRSLDALNEPYLRSYRRHPPFEALLALRAELLEDGKTLLADDENGSRYLAGHLLADVNSNVFEGTDTYKLEGLKLGNAIIGGARLVHLAVYSLKEDPAQEAIREYTRLSVLAGLEYSMARFETTAVKHSEYKRRSEVGYSSIPLCVKRDADPQKVIIGSDLAAALVSDLGNSFDPSTFVRVRRVAIDDQEGRAPLY